MELKPQAYDARMFTEGNDPYLTGRYGWIEGLVDGRGGIPAPVENLAK